VQIAILSDIHGNLPALEAVIARLEAEGIEQLVCLGDVAIFGPQPGEVLARLRGLDCPVVAGNTDVWLLDPLLPEQTDENARRITDIELWGARQLGSEWLAYIRTFQPTISLPLDDGVELLCFHGSPRSHSEVITADTAEEQLAQMLSGYHATVMAGGHTHVQMLRRYG
jgi:predicted phosphodiesterase